MTKAMHYGLAALLACAFLAGCGGGGGEPTVTQTVHDDLQAELDAALAELAETETEAARLNAQLLSANADVTRLTTELATANANVDTLTTELAGVTAALTAAAAEVTQLTADLTASSGQVTELTTERNTATARVTELETRIGDAINPAPGSLLAQIAQLTIDLAAEEAKVAALTGQLSTAEEERDTAQAAVETAQQEAQEAVETAQEAVETAEQQAQQQAQQRVQGQEASQRARYLQAAFLLEPPALDSDIQMNVPSRGSLVLTRGTSWGRATLGGSGLRSATMPLTSTVNTGKTVVYTDRELSRLLLEHFGHLRDPSNRNLLTFTDGELNFSTVDADGESTNGRSRHECRQRHHHGHVEADPQDSQNRGTRPEGQCSGSTCRS